MQHTNFFGEIAHAPFRPVDHRQMWKAGKAAHLFLTNKLRKPFRRKTKKEKENYRHPHQSNRHVVTKPVHLPRFNIGMLLPPM